MNKTLIIIQREFMTRVKKKSFILLTILMPFIFAALIFVPLWLASIKDSGRRPYKGEYGEGGEYGPNAAWDELVSKEKFDTLVKAIPSMRSPTVSPLFGDSGYAVKTAVKKSEVPVLLPKLKEFGATDILEYELRKVMS